MFPMAEQPWCECESCQLRIFTMTMNWYPMVPPSHRVINLLWKLVAPAPFTGPLAVLLFVGRSTDQHFFGMGIAGDSLESACAKRLLLEALERTGYRWGWLAVSGDLSWFIMGHWTDWTCGSVLVAIVLIYRWVDLDDACDSKWFNSIGSTQLPSGELT